MSRFKVNNQIISNMEDYSVPDFKLKLQRNYRHIVSSILHRQIVDILIGNHVLTFEESEIIESGTTQNDKNRLLLKILFRGNANCYNKFLAALRETAYGQLATQIENTDVKNDKLMLIDAMPRDILDYVEVTPGASLRGTYLSSIIPRNFLVACGTEVENWTKFKLESSEIHLRSGEIASPVLEIIPGYKEAIISHKRPYWPVYGVCAMASWLIRDCNRRLVIMWSTPYPTIYYVNKLSIGLSDANITTHNPRWHRRMRLCQECDGLKYKTEEYSNTSKTITLVDNQFEVTGIMGNGHHAEVKVILKPNKMDDLAPSLKQKVFSRMITD